MVRFRRFNQMTASISLRDASVQEIQLELLRRTKFNAFDRERVYASLMAHRDLWLAVLLDRPGVANYAEPGLPLMSGLIKLRDLPDNIWNADTLYILTRRMSKPARWPRSAKKKVGRKMFTFSRI